MTLSRVFSLAAVLLLAGQSCFAQTEESDSTPKIQYHVEVIAFQYQGPDTSAGEDVDRLLVENYLPGGSFDIDEYNRVRETVSYTNVVQLGSALERLRASPQYSVLAASAWEQPLLSQSEAVSVPLGYEPPASSDSSGEYSRTRASPGLTGSVRIYGGHLLFANMELRATLPRRAPADEGSGQSFSASSAERGADSGRTRLGDRFQSFRISETRRIKLEEVHYFDHPYIGAILSVTRYEP